MTITALTSVTGHVVTPDVCHCVYYPRAASPLPSASMSAVVVVYLGARCRPSLEPCGINSLFWAGRP